MSLPPFAAWAGGPLKKATTKNLKEQSYVKIAALLLLLLVSACASTDHTLADCSGPLETFSQSSWHPSVAELDAIAARMP